MNAEYQLTRCYAWDLNNQRHYVTINRRLDYYLIRVDGVFYSTAESMVEAMDETADAITSNGWKRGKFGECV